MRRSKWPRNSCHSCVGWGAVFLGGAQRAAAGDECAVAVDGLLGVDGLVAHGGVDVVVPGDQLGDVRRHAVHDRVGDEDPAEVVRGESQWPAAGVGDAGAGQGVVDELADGRVADRAGSRRRSGAGTAAASAGSRRVRGSRRLRPAVRRRARRGSGGRSAASTSASSGPMTRSRSLSVLDGAMCSSGISSPVAGQPVLDQAVMGQFGEFLDPDAGMRAGPRTAAQVQNAWCSSRVRSRRLPVPGSSAQVLPADAWVVTRPASASGRRR